LSSRSGGLAWREATGEQLGEGALAVAVGTQQTDAIVRVEAQVEPCSTG
jgi:hypothetical protein